MKREEGKREKKKGKRWKFWRRKERDKVDPLRVFPTKSKSPRSPILEIKATTI